MDYRTAVRDIGNMDAKSYRDYFDMDKSAGDVPEKPDDYYSFSDTKDIGEGKVSTKTAAPKETGAMSKMNGPDQPATEPGQAPGATKDWTAEDFQNMLGLSKRSDVGDNFNEGAGATDSDKTKSNPLLGKGYLSDEDFNRLKGDSKFQDLYMKEAGNFSGSKAERIKSGDFDWDEMSINHMDAFLDKFGSKLSGGGGEKPKYNKSDKLARAQAGVAAFEQTILPYQGDIIVGRKPNYAQEYADQFKVNLRNDPDYSWKFEGENKEENEEKKKGIDFTGTV